MRTEVGQPGVGREPIENQIFGRARQHGLPAVGQIAQACGPVDGRADVVALVTQLHLPGMHANAQPDRSERCPLQLQRARHRVAGPGERDHEAIAFALFDRPQTVMGGDELAHRPIEPRDGAVISSGWVCHRRVELSTSASSNVTVPVGSSLTTRSLQSKGVSASGSLMLVSMRRPHTAKHRRNRVDLPTRRAELRHRTANIYAPGPMISRRRHRIVDSYQLEETTMTIHTIRFNATLDREAALAAISAAAWRFTALLRETDDIERPVAGTDWTVAETAAHVSVVLTGFSAAIAGE